MGSRDQYTDTARGGLVNQVVWDSRKIFWGIRARPPKCLFSLMKGVEHLTAQNRLWAYVAPSRTTELVVFIVYNFSCVTNCPLTKDKETIA